MNAKNICPFLENGYICQLEYWGGKTTKSQCSICKTLGRNSIEARDKIKSNPKEIWKMNGYSSEELFSALEKQKKINGLGDAVHKIAQPIAKTIDKIFGTNIKECGGCKRRRNLLNKAFPINQD